MLGTGKQPWLMPEALRWRFRDARIGVEVTPTGAGGAHLQHPVRRRPPGRRRADRGGLRLVAVGLETGCRLDLTIAPLRAAGPRGRQGPLPRDLVRARRQARSAVRALCVQPRDRRRARPRARADGGRNPPAMVARCARTASGRARRPRTRSRRRCSTRSRASHLPRAPLLDLIEAHAFDLYDDPMPTLAALEAYGRQTSSAVFAQAALICGANAGEAAEHAGLAWRITELLRAFARHASRRQLFVPEEMLGRHSARAEDIFAGRSTPELQRALAELRSRGAAASGGVRGAASAIAGRQRCRRSCRSRSCPDISP